MKKIQLITANVGSLFEEDCKLHEPWVNNLVQKFQTEEPDFCIIHLQETGGKKFAENAWQAPEIVKQLHKALGPDYPIIRAYLDIEFWVETFTALGIIVFVRSTSVADVRQYNFMTNGYQSELVLGLKMEKDQLDDDYWLRKRKFPKHFWSTVKWGRKGFMHSRFLICGQVFDFVNVHLFHDESNLALIHENPATYSDNRKRALNFVLKELYNEREEKDPFLFIFGDLNFRLDSQSFLRKLTLKTAIENIEEPHGSTSHLDTGVHHNELLRRTVSAVEFRTKSEDEEPKYNGNLNGNGCVLRIEKKKFDYFDQPKLLTEWPTYLEDDKELKEFARELFEFPITFPPTYPWCEEPELFNALMKTRAPAWCDRILMNEKARDLVRLISFEYNSFGREVCTGDHKPVYLVFEFDSPSQK